MRQAGGSVTSVGLWSCVALLGVAGLPAGAAYAQPEEPPIDLLDDEPDDAPTGLPDPADDTPPPALDRAAIDASYSFGRVRVEFATRHPELPLIESLGSMGLGLAVVDGVLVPSASSTMSLDQLLDLRDAGITIRGINALSGEFVEEMNRRGIVGVLVAPDPSQIDPRTGEDLRADDGDLVVKIWVGLVTEIRSVASGERLENDEPAKHPAHRRIVNLSPAQPWDGRPGPRKNLLRREVLENYVYRLNRHPGRRVDIAVAAASDPGSPPDAVALDYLVRESKPWTAYAQISNTGTKQTNEIRQRFGFVHRQLTGRDDILRIDLATASFDETFGGIISYEAPLPGTTLAKVRGFGTFNEYVASDIGLVGQDLEGTSSTYGGELIVTALQDRSLFVDTFFGVTGKQYEVINDLAGTESDVSLVIGSAGVRVEDRRPTRSFSAEVAFDWTIDGGDRTALPGLGRLGVDEEWVRLRWDTSVSAFLEPLLWPNAWADTSSPGSSTLGHEVVLAFRGQAAFDDRFIPQEQGVAGGFYSVRGYPESATAGDTLLIGSAEYRIHVPALLGMGTNPGAGDSFRWRRDRPYGSADWDLVLAGFVDAGQTMNTNAEASEFDETLLGAGVGLGLDIRRNVSIRADWGFALEDLDNGTTRSGDSEVHFVATLAY